MADLIGQLYDKLTPSVGGFVLLGLAAGVIAGLIRNAVSRFGIVKATIAAAAIVVAAWGMSCIPRPTQVEAQPQQTSVKKATARVLQKARPHRRRRYVQYPGF